MSLANVLYRLGYDSDATAVMQYSLEVYRCTCMWIIYLYDKSLHDAFTFLNPYCKD